MYLSPQSPQARALAHYSALAAAARTAQATPGPWVWRGSRLCPVNPDPRNHAVHTILTRGDSFGFLGAALGMVDAELGADFAVIEAAPLLHKALTDLVNAASIALAGSNVLQQAEAALAAAEPLLPVPEVADSDFDAFMDAQQATGDAA